MLEGAANRALLFIFVLSLLYVLIFGEDGLLTYLKLKKNLRDSTKRIAMLQEENKNMRMEIDRLRNDKEYLEDIVRKKYGLIREGEKVYRFER
ncbi:MAG: septum formation initiator family protein [Desulfobacterota bacterium]|nr:septum formation initiator family protein [Thermodesulfobacteriota bacterium]MDW8001154.1 septum formation initiator family protein [Deltaproteobacteria bacterium]